MKKLNITFCSFPDYAGNAKALFEYMKNRYGDEMNYTWIVYNEASVNLLKKRNIKSILIGSDEFEKYIPKTNVFFTTQGNLDADKEKTKNAIYIELWHGIGPKPSGFCQGNPSKEDVRGYSNIREIVDYFIVPSEFWKPIWGAIFNVEYSRIKSLGLPILDQFKNSDGKDNLSNLLNIDLNKYKKAIIYMPTFRNAFDHLDIKKTTSNIFNIEDDYDDIKLNNFLKKNNYLLCVKPHPAELSKISIIESDNIKIITEDAMIKKQITVNEIMNAFDLLITDYSSIGTEFLFLDKPLLFNTCDIDEYLKNRGLYFGDADFWFPGPKFNNLKELLKESKKLIDDDLYYRKERQEKRKLWYGNLKSGGCDKICDFLFDGCYISDRVVHHNSKLKQLEKDNNKKNIKIKEQSSRIKYLKEKELKLASIENSRSYKMIQKLNNIRKKVIKHEK